MSTPFRLELPQALYEAMLQHARAELPNECCGVLAGVTEEGVARVVWHFPLINELASPIRYCVEGKGMLAAHRACRENHWEFVAFYHSHPTTQPIPSKTDMEEFLWEGTMMFIISLEGEAPVMRGWWITAVDYREGDWELI